MTGYRKPLMFLFSHLWLWSLPSEPQEEWGFDPEIKLPISLDLTKWAFFFLLVFSHP